MTQTPLTILLVEDNPADARLLQIALREVGAGVVRLIHVQTLSAALQHSQDTACDCILLDFYLPDSQGVDTVRRMREHAPDAPIIVLTGLNDEAIAQQMLDAGAQGYLIKGRLDGAELLRTLREAIARKQHENDD